MALRIGQRLVGTEPARYALFKNGELSEDEATQDW